MADAKQKLLLPRWIIPVVPSGALLENHALLIDGERIADLLPRDVAITKYAGAEHIELGKHLLIPGLINMHGHGPMTLLRGLGDDSPLQRWLEDTIWPIEGQWVSDTFVRDGVRLACAEMIRGGVTSFADMYFFPDMIAQVAVQSGMRAQIAFPIIDFPSAWAKNGEEYLHRGLELHDSYRDHPLVQVAFGPHAPYTVSDKLMEQVATLAGELDSVIHIHLHETAHEVTQYSEQHNQRPLARLNEMGIIGPRTQCVHMTQVDESDLKALQSCNAQVIHCPQSNLKLASGLCPVHRLHTAGINVAIGTDGAASNNNLDLMEEMRTAALLGKAVAEDASACDAKYMLEMATINAAKAMGCADDLGSLEIGKLADITALEISGPEAFPLYHPLSWLIYAASSRQVSHVWVAGKALLTEGQHNTLDVPAIYAKAQDWATKIRNSLT